MAPKTCSQCGQPVEEPLGLCPACMLKQGLSAETTPQEERSCAGCGRALDDDARFCPGCGAAAPSWPGSSDDPLRQALEVKLGGQYRILRLLGRGGMGAVYLARDLTLEREVAIKVVKTTAESTNLVDRFRREAKTAAQLSHPNIVPLHAFGNIDGMPYFVMGYVRGESLADRLRRDGRIREDEARRILAEIADALDHAHRQGVVHRDVKPDNVLLEDASGRALLTDFGIARSMTHGQTLTQHGSVVGTPHYMSPEQAAGHASIDGRSDLYSLGVMGYAMIGGRLPFEGTSSAEILSKHLTQQPPSLRSLAPTVSDATQQAIERCLAKDPDKRWSDARALRMSLGSVDDAGLPDALEAVHGHGMTFLLISIALLALAWGVVVRLQNAPPVVFGFIAAMIAFGYVAVVVGLRLEGFPLGLVQRVIWSEPEWWRGWYPRSLRRRTNIWDRLPRRVRRFRAFVPLLFISLAVAAVDPTHYFTVKLLVFVVVFLTTVVLEFMTKRELRRMGIRSANDLNRVTFSAPPSRARFWNQPRIAAVLAPPKPELRRAGTPNEQLQEVLRLAGELTGPLRELGADAAAAGRRLLASIDQSERQIAELARNVEAGEEQRLLDKIASLGDGEDSAPMRDLLARQLDLVRALGARIEVAKADRSRHIEMLRTLALHLASLRARVSTTSSPVGSLSADVRALCDQIAGQGGVKPADMPTVPQ
jgi:RNA polymerase subunit RPABC4/transcription elongation factor Spt4